MYLIKYRHNRKPAWNRDYIVSRDDYEKTISRDIKRGLNVTIYGHIALVRIA